MWADIVISNKKSLISQITNLINEGNNFLNTLKEGDINEIKSVFEKAKKAKDNMTKSI